MPFIRKVRVLFKTRLIFPRINGPIELLPTNVTVRNCRRLHVLVDVFFLGKLVSFASPSDIDVSLSSTLGNIRAIYTRKNKTRLT